MKESFDLNKHIPISVYSLKSEMKIDYSIFYKKDSNYVLLCKDVILTSELINKFYDFTSPDYTIYIPKEHVQKIRSYNPTTQMKKVYEGYTEVKSNVADMLSTVSSEEKIHKEVSDSISKMIHTQVDTVDVSKIIDSINSVREIDEYLYTHSANVALLNGLIGKWMDYDTKSRNDLIKVGLLHDIGKLKIPKEILNKPGKLTKDEFEIIKRHPIYSCEILRNSNVNDEAILNGIVQHHEKVNGLGYPYNLGMNKITDYAKITAISDVYDAMVSKRVYKSAHSPFEILSWFANGRYSELDIDFVNMFLKIMTIELTGKTVLLSNGKVAKVVYVDMQNLEFPYVEIAGKVLPTSPELNCVHLIE